MAETVEGGAYLSADGKTWHDANGNEIKAPKGAEKSESEEVADVATGTTSDKSTARNK